MTDGLPGTWEGDLIVGARGQSAAVKLVECTTRLLMLLALPEGKGSASETDTVIEHVVGLPEMMCGSIMRDQGTEMARQAALTLATSMPVYFVYPRSPWERGTNENTNGLVLGYLPKRPKLLGISPALPRSQTR